MTKHAYQQSVFSGSDTVAVAPFAQITVTNSSDDSAASIWSDAAGANPIADGVLLADENGYFIFYADEGTYNIAILSDGISKTLENVEIGAGNPYSGVFKGNWDMSSGVFSPAMPATDYQATHTDTTVTPNATLTGNGPYYVALSSSNLIPIQSSGSGAASIIVPEYGLSDSVKIATLVLANSGATFVDIEDMLLGNQPTNPTWAIVSNIAINFPAAIYGHYNNDSLTGDGITFCAAGDVLLLDYDFATATATISVNGNPVGTAAINASGIPVGQGLRLYAGVLSDSTDVVFDAGSITVNFNDTSVGGTGFTVIHDADLPVGAQDGDWYEVSVGGYFHGKTTRAGQFVKLIRGKTDLIVVGDPSPPAVQYAPQTLTSAEQAQARANISAASIADVLIFG